MTTTQTPETATQRAKNEKPAAEGKPAATESAKEATEYVILRAMAEENAWEVMPERVTATNKETALRKYGDAQEEGGDLKAVAVSAWRGGKRSKKEQFTKTVYEDLDD